MSCISLVIKKKKKKPQGTPVWFLQDFMQHEYCTPYQQVSHPNFAIFFPQE
jgi:hypothetical protein